MNPNKLSRQEPALYSRLEHPDSIRLFRLLPSQHESDALEGELFTSRRSDQPAYQALSYMWGPKATTTEHQLLVNSHILPLRSNIYSALLAIREHRRHGRIRTDYSLWIDLICIQQDEVKEKNHQVQQMGAIYAEAESVIIWLGEQTRLHLPKHQIRRVAGLNHAKGSTDEYTALFWALLNQHWGRTWILQEICLAKRVSIVTKQHIFKGSQLQQFMTRKADVDEMYREAWIVLDDKAEHPHTTIVAAIERFEKIWMVRQSRRDPRWKPLSLCSTIHQLALYSECFEHRDKVYALVPMASADNDIKIDYSIDEVALFWEVIKTINIKDIDEYEISALREVLKLSWDRILLQTETLMLTDTTLQELKLPCRLDCGFLSLKRARQVRQRRINKRHSLRLNCHFQKDTETAPFLLQLHLRQDLSDVYIVKDAAYCPDIKDKTIYHELCLSGCKIKSLDASWDKRQELIAVDPMLYVTLYFLADLKQEVCTAELRKVFPHAVTGEDRYLRQRRAARQFGAPLKE